MFVEVTRNALILAALLIAASALSYAQTSHITGRVADMSGAVVPGAVVTVTHVDTGVNREVKTNTEGYYTVPLLPQGNYRVGVRLAGFRSPARSGIVLDEGQTLRLDFTLEVGQVTETLEVKGGAPLLETEHPALSTVITNEKIVDLPLLGRNPVNLALLVPGVRAVGPFGGLWSSSYNTSSMSISGGPPSGNNFMVDGVAAEHFTSGGFQVYLSVDGTAEFRIITRNASAEFGRTGGGVINVISKSRTNDFHGTLFEFLRNKSLNANGFFQNRAGATRAPFTYNQYGAALGGPIQKNKTFFFSNWERVNQRSTASVFRTVPTPLQRQGDFSQTQDAAGRTIIIYDPATTRANPANPSLRIRDPFPGDSIPQGRIHPVARAVAGYYPAPNTPGAPITNASNFFGQGPNGLDKDIYGIKIDRYLTPARRVSARYTYDNTLQTAASYWGIADNNNSGQGFMRSSVVLSYTDSLRPDLLLELRGGANRVAQVRRARSLGFDVSKIGLPAVLNSETQLMLFPAFAITDVNTIGGNQTDDQVQTNGSWSGSGSLTRISGAHTIKLGGEERIYYNNNTQGGPNMTFGFARNFTRGPDPNTTASNAGFGVATFLLGYPTSGQATRYATTTYTSKYFGTFLQDDWKVTPKLTLNFGLRWEFQAALTDRFNAISNFNPGLVTNAGGITLRGGLEYPGTGGLSRGNRDKWFRDFGPRFGFAYQVVPKTVIRGGYGVFYVPDTGNFISLSATGFSIATNMVTSVDGGFTPYDTLTNPFPQGIQLPPGSKGGALTGLGTGVAGNLRKLTRPYDLQWNLNVQRELPGKWLVEIGYAGNRGVHLAASRTYDFLPDTNLSLGAALQQQVPNPFYGIIATGQLSQPTVTRGSLLDTFPQFLSAGGLDNWASSIYHALTVRVEKRFSHGFSVLASYTFSKTIDDNLGNGTLGNAFLSGGSNGVQNWSNTRAERAISTDDLPQRFVFTTIWELPLGKTGAALYRKLAGGWQLNSVLSLQSGEPIAITQAAAPFGGGRPMVVGDPNLGNPTIDRWFNTAAFAATPAFTYGNAPRNLPRTRTDGAFNWECSMLKNIAVKERFRLQIRGEFFSFTNTPVFGAPGTLLLDGSFGVVRAAGGTRNVQLGMKIVF
ncbi:MAG: TonB-dependent receptor [Acidobacteria bacterium]|nr:TonB-dependent receptor [Acidobacteriota bacterium]